MTSITINGKILTILEKEFENKKTVYAQFLMESESKGMEIIKVKIVKEEDILKLEEYEDKPWITLFEGTNLPSVVCTNLPSVVCTGLP